MIVTSLAAPTVMVVVPVTPDIEALICEVPCAVPVARPAAVTVAMPGFDDAHVAEPVRSDVDPSEYVPSAWNCCVVPLLTVGFPGVRAIDASACAPTVRVVLAVCPAEVALIWDVPGATPLASPPAAMLATAVLEEDHVAE